MIRTAEVTVATEEKTVVCPGRDQRPTFMWCPVCHRQVEMVTPEEAAKLAGVNPRTIYRWIETGKLHFYEPQNASLLICQSSLCRLSRREMRRDVRQKAETVNWGDT